MTILRIRQLAESEARASGKDPGGSPAGAAIFVAEANDEAGAWQVVASLRLLPGIGLEAPRYWYYVGQVAYSAEALKLNRRDNVLLLGSDFTGANEIRDVRCESAAVTADARTTLLASLIQGALKLASGTASSAKAARTIIALPGRREQGRSPFWDGLGRHFYDRDPAQAIAEFGERWHTDVAALLPQQPVIVSLLSASAKRAIGSVDDDAVELAAALTVSGFRARQHVSIHDGGPVYEHDPAAGSESWAELEFEAVDHLERSQTWAILQGGALCVVQAELAAGRLRMERSTVQLLSADSRSAVASPLGA